MKDKSLEEAVPLFICKSQITSDQDMRVEHETRGQHASDILEAAANWKNYCIEFS